MKSFISYIEKIFGVECSPELIDAVRMANDDKYVELSDKYNNDYETSDFSTSIEKNREN